MTTARVAAAYSQVNVFRSARGQVTPWPRPNESEMGWVLSASGSGPLGPKLVGWLATYRVRPVRTATSASATQPRR